MVGCLLNWGATEGRLSSSMVPGGKERRMQRLSKVCNATCKEYDKHTCNSATSSLKRGKRTFAYFFFFFFLHSVSPTFHSTAHSSTPRPCTGPGLSLPLHGAFFPDQPPFGLASTVETLLPSLAKAVLLPQPWTLRLGHSNS